MLSTVALTHSLPFWQSELHPSMPSSHHLLRTCTNPRFRPPFLPESATLTQQSSRFMNKLMPTWMPPSHRQTNDANLLHPYMPASPLWHMTPSIRSGCLPLWYVSCQKTATKCASARPHISAPLPAPAKPAQLLQPLPVAPAMPAILKPQTPAVPKVTPVPAPTSATPSIAPVQPHRSGCACTAPKCLIQEL